MSYHSFIEEQKQKKKKKKKNKKKKKEKKKKITTEVKICSFVVFVLNRVFMFSFR